MKFWRNHPVQGVTASYMGISETIIQFVLYEHFRNIIDNSHTENTNENTKFLNFMIAGGMVWHIPIQAIKNLSPN